MLSALGLAISSQIVNLLGGQLSVESKLAEGVYSLRIPFDAKGDEVGSRQ